MKIWRRVVAGAVAAVMTVAFVPVSAFATTAKTDLPFTFESTDYGLMGADGVSAQKLTITNSAHAQFVTPEADSIAQGYSLIKEDKSRDGYYHLYLIGVAGVAHEFQNTDESVVDGIKLTRAAYYWEDCDYIGNNNHLKNYETGLADNLLQVYNPATDDYGIFNADTGVYYDYNVDDVNWCYSDGKNLAIEVEKDGLYGLIKGDGSWLARPHYREFGDRYLENGFVIGYDPDEDAINGEAIITLSGNTVSKDGGTVSLQCNSVDAVSGDFLLVCEFVQTSSSRTSNYYVLSISSGTVLKSFTYDELEENWGFVGSPSTGEDSLCFCGWVFNEKFPAGVNLATKYRVAKSNASSSSYGFYGCGIRPNTGGGYLFIANYQKENDFLFNAYTLDENLKEVNVDLGINSSDCNSLNTSTPLLICNGCSDNFLYYGDYYTNENYYGTNCAIKQVKSRNSAVSFGGSTSDVIFTPVGNDYFIASPGNPVGGSSWPSTNPCYVINGQNGQKMEDTVGCCSIYPSQSIVNFTSNQETYEYNGFLVLRKDSGEDSTYALFNTANGKVSKFYDEKPEVVCVTDEEAGQAFIEVGDTYLDGNFNEISELKGDDRVYIDPVNNTVSIGYFTIYSYNPTTLALTKVTSFSCWTYGWSEVASYYLGVAKIYPATNSENDSIDLVNSKGEGIYQGASGTLYNKQVYPERGMALYYASSNVRDDPSVQLIDDSGKVLVSGDFKQSQIDDSYDYVRFYGDLCLMFPDVDDANVLYIYDVSDNHDESVSSTKVTEKHLYTTSEYSSYLVNKGYEKACQRVMAAEGEQLFSQSELATALAAFKSNASDLTGTYEKILKNHIMGKDEDGYTYTELELYEALAQEMVENLQSYKATDEEDLYSDIKSVYKTVKKIKKTGKYVFDPADKAGVRSGLVSVLKMLTYSGSSKTSVLGPLQIITDDETCKEFFEWADNKTEVLDNSIDAIDLILDYAVLWRLDMDTIQMLEKNIPTNSGLYKGLSRMEYKMNHPSLSFVEGVLDTLIGDAVDMFKDAGESFLEYAVEIGSGTFYLADLSWKLASELMPGPDIDASNEAWLSFNNAMTMYNAMEEYRAQIIEDTRAENPNVNYKARRKVLKLLTNAVNASFGVAAEKIATRDESSGNDNAQRVYNAYENMMSYNAYIHSCLANAGAGWTYSVSGGQATITGYVPSSSVKSSWDSYLLDVPSTITDEDGNEYTVVAVDSGTFGEESGVGAIEVGANVEVASDAIADGTAEQVLTADQEVAEDGLQVTETGNISFDDEGTLSVSGYELQVTYEDGTIETVDADAAYVKDATHIALVYGGAEVLVAASDVKAPTVVRYEDENGDKVAADDLGSTAYDEAPTSTEVTIPEGYSKTDESSWTREGGTWVKTVTCTSQTRSIAMATIAAIEKCSYTGQALEPKVTVTFGDETLVEGQDYTVTYVDNIEGVETEEYDEDFGTYVTTYYATAIVTGTGNYAGSQSASFEIGKTSGGGDADDSDDDGDMTQVNKGKVSVGSTAYSISGGKEYIYKFTPNASATYKLYSTGSYDTFGALYDSSMRFLKSDDDSGSDQNFYISAYLRAGKTYYIGIHSYFGGTANGTLHIVKPVTSRKVAGVTYTISGKAATVSAAVKTVKKVTIPATVKIGSGTYKVSSIKASAFSGCKKLTTVTIGSNVASIGAKAFFGCKKLKKLVIKTKKLKTVGSKAFKGNTPKCKVTYPSGKKAAYKKKLKKAGLKM